MKIYLVNGKARSGKDTTSDFIKKFYLNNNIKVCILQISSTIKNYAKDHFDLKEKEREFLQKFGSEVLKEKLKKDTFLLNRVNEDIEILSNFFDIFIISDVRLKKEIEYFKNKYNDVVTIRVNRKDFNNNLSTDEKSHITENDLDDYNDFDYIINNDGNLEKLINEVNKIVEENL